MLFSLKFHRDNRQNALALYFAKRKTGEKGCIFHRTVEMKQPQTITEPFRKHAAIYFLFSSTGCHEAALKEE